MCITYYLCFNIAKLLNLTPGIVDCGSRVFSYISEY